MVSGVSHLDEQIDKRRLLAKVQEALAERRRGEIFEMISAERLKKIRKVVADRTRTVIPVLDRICDLGNAHAVFRSAELLGFQEVQLILNPGGWKLSKRTTQGADKWLDLVKWKDSQSCINALKRRGYQIVATSFEKAVPIQQLDFSQPTALIFGNEREGVDSEILSQADSRCYVPTSGFTQSFNISVAVALALQEVRSQRIRAFGKNGDLSATEQKELIGEFCLRTLDSRVSTFN